MFVISEEKLGQILAIFNTEVDSTTTSGMLRSEICGQDWYKAGHQEWINNTSAREIADWLMPYYRYDYRIRG